MPRRRSGGRSARPAPLPAAERNPPPQPVNHAPPPAPLQSSSGGSMLGSIGSTIAHRPRNGVGNRKRSCAQSCGCCCGSSYNSTRDSCLSSCCCTRTNLS